MVDDHRLEGKCPFLPRVVIPLVMDRVAESLHDAFIDFFMSHLVGLAHAYAIRMHEIETNRCSNFGIVRNF